MVNSDLLSRCLSEPILERDTDYEKWLFSENSHYMYYERDFYPKKQGLKGLSMPTMAYKKFHPFDSLAGTPPRFLHQKGQFIPQTQLPGVRRTL